MNHKRLEILKKEDGKWQRTGNIPYDNFYYWNLEIGEGYKSYIVKSLIDDDLKELTEQLGNDKEGIEQVAKNARKAKTALKFFNGRVYLLEDFSEETLINYNCGIQF